ncbi:unnamed protein product [Blepharisma stoltei]|uniref:NADH dehydrogenase subunit 4L n=1 Tax=Blepharisma stoltei TaxID=1481888 RepID=A0AAU9J4E3_9CILI|nr:unnamed protein product [Blepharisma stoltei]
MILLVLLNMPEIFVYLIISSSVVALIFGISLCCFIKALRNQKLNCYSIWKLLAPLLILMWLSFVKYPKLCLSLFMTEDMLLVFKEI